MTSLYLGCANCGHSGYDFEVDELYFSNDGDVRCPECRSTDVDEVGTVLARVFAELRLVRTPLRNDQVNMDELKEAVRVMMTKIDGYERPKSSGFLLSSTMPVADAVEDVIDIIVKAVQDRRP